MNTELHGLLRVVQMVDSRWNTAMHYAYSHSHKELADLLCERGGEPSRHVRNSDGKLPHELPSASNPVQAFLQEQLRDVRRQSSSTSPPMESRSLGSASSRPSLFPRRPLHDGLFVPPGKERSPNEDQPRDPEQGGGGVWQGQRDDRPVSSDAPEAPAAWPQLRRRATAASISSVARRRVRNRARSVALAGGRQLSISDLYLNRTAAPSHGDYSLSDLFLTVDKDGDGAISVMRELTVALTAVGLFWDNHLSEILIEGGEDHLVDHLQNWFHVPREAPPTPPCGKSHSDERHTVPTKRTVADGDRVSSSPPETNGTVRSATPPPPPRRPARPDVKVPPTTPSSASLVSPYSSSSSSSPHPSSTSSAAQQQRTFFRRQRPDQLDPVHETTEPIGQSTAFPATTASAAPAPAPATSTAQPATAAAVPRIRTTPDASSGWHSYFHSHRHGSRTPFAVTPSPLARCVARGPRVALDDGRTDLLMDQAGFCALVDLLRFYKVYLRVHLQSWSPAKSPRRIMSLPEQNFRRRAQSVSGNRPRHTSPSLLPNRAVSAVGPSRYEEDRSRPFGGEVATLPTAGGGEDEDDAAPSRVSSSQSSCLGGEGFPDRGFPASGGTLQRTRRASTYPPSEANPWLPLPMRSSQESLRSPDASSEGRASALQRPKSEPILEGHMHHRHEPTTTTTSAQADEFDADVFVEDAPPVASAARSDARRRDGEQAASPSSDSGAVNGTSSHIDIFLGGACNPTTWRTDTAIPMLETAGLSYYNPQVDEWAPWMIAAEAAAKEAARVVLFVVSDETRAVASMIEASELIASGKEVVLVVQDIGPEHEIGGQRLQPDELKDLNRGRAYLADVAARHGETVFESVEAAVQHAVEILMQSPSGESNGKRKREGQEEAGEEEEPGEARHSDGRDQDQPATAMNAHAEREDTKMCAGPEDSVVTALRSNGGRVGRPDPAQGTR